MASKRTVARPPKTGTGMRRRDKHRRRGLCCWLDKDKLYGRSRYLHEAAHGRAGR